MITIAQVTRHGYELQGKVQSARFVAFILDPDLYLFRSAVPLARTSYRFSMPLLSRLSNGDNFLPHKNVVKIK